MQAVRIKSYHEFSQLTLCMHLHIVLQSFFQVRTGSMVGRQVYQSVQTYNACRWHSVEFSCRNRGRNAAEYNYIYRSVSKCTLEGQKRQTDMLLSPPSTTLDKTALPLFTFRDTTIRKILSRSVD